MPNVPTTRETALHYMSALLPHLDGDADTLLLGELTRRDMRNIHAIISNLLPPCQQAPLFPTRQSR